MKERQKIINETKSLFFEKINQIDKVLARLIKKKKERIWVNKVRNEKEVTSTREIQRIIGDYEQLYTNKMDNLEEMDNFLLLLSRFSCVWLCATPETAAHQAPLSLGFSRQGHWSALPFPSPMHESEKWKWSHSVVSNSATPRTTRLLRPCDFPGKSTGMGCHCLLLDNFLEKYNFPRLNQEETEHMNRPMTSNEI